jgi:hypothetical protein
MKTNQAFRFLISKISDLEFYLSNEHPEALEASELEVESGVTFASHPETGKVQVCTTVAYRDISTEAHKDIMSYRGAFEFDLMGEDGLIVERPVELSEIQKELLATLIQISISSTRGIIHARTAGSEVNNFPLPIIDALALAEDMIQKQK